MNILINTTNSYFAQGVMRVIELLSYNDLRLTITVGKIDSLCDTDIVFFEADADVFYFCQPWQRQNNRAVLVGMCNQLSPALLKIPDCLNDMILINKKMSLDDLCNVIRSCFTQAENNQARVPQCHKCRRTLLSKQQKSLLECLKLSMSVEAISRAMNLSPKTIFSHKYIIMKKFGFETNKQLLEFSNKISKDA